MPLALALLLLLGLSGPGGRGCLQCDHSVQEALSQLRLALVPKRFHQERLQARAQALLLGMEGPFFRDYALNAFVGKVGACWRGEGAWHSGGKGHVGGSEAGVGRQALWGPQSPRGEGGTSPGGGWGGGVPWLSEGPTGISSPLGPRDRSPGTRGVLYQEPNEPLNG